MKTALLAAVCLATAVAASAAEKLQLAVIPKSTNGDFWQTVERGVRRAEKDFDVTVRWEGAVTETEIAEQNKIIENMVNLGVQGMALAPLNQRAMRRQVKAAVDAGIPVVIFDSAVDGDAHTSYIATDNTAGGALGAKALVELVGPKAGARVVCMRFIQGTGSTEARTAGFLAAAKAAGYNVVADPYADRGTIEGCKSTAANTLERFVEGGTLRLDGIFASNLDSTIGMTAALADLRKSGVKTEHVKFVGFDSSKRLIEELQAGNLDALVVQNPERMGYLAVEVLVKVLRKETVPAVIDTGTVLVTKDLLAKDADARKLVGLE